MSNQKTELTYLFKNLNDNQRKQLMAAIKALPDEISTVLFYRFGLHDNSPLTERQVAEVVGKPVKEVREILSTALTSLKATAKQLFMSREQAAREILGISKDTPEGNVSNLMKALKA